MDKKDVFAYFLHLRNNYEDEEVYKKVEDFEISKLDVNRIYRYLDKYTKDDSENDEDNISLSSDI